MTSHFDSQRRFWSTMTTSSPSVPTHTIKPQLAFVVISRIHMHDKCIQISIFICTYTYTYTYTYIHMYIHTHDFFYTYKYTCIYIYIHTYIYIYIYEYNVHVHVSATTKCRSLHTLSKLNSTSSWPQTPANTPQRAHQVTILTSLLFSHFTYEFKQRADFWEFLETS